MKRTTTALLVGIAIGGIAGILFAPEKGKKIRRKIRNQKNDLQEFMKVKLHTVLESMKDKLELTSEKANKFLDIEKALNSKIMKLTLKIQDECPELAKFIEETPDNLHAHTDPEITLRNLKAYADSLEDMHKKYMRDHKQNVN